MANIDLEKKYSVEEYLALEAQSQLRHELFYGNLFEMPGNTILHNQRCQMIYFSLRENKLNELYSIAMVSLKVKIPKEEVFLYPSVVVGQKVVKPAETFIIPNPILIAEVLSDSTRRYNFIDKFIQYRKIDSLQYYIMVEPEKQVVFFYEKADDGDWVAKTYTENDEEIRLPLLNATLRLGDIYGK